LNAANLTANGVPVVGGDTPVQHGNILFVSEVLFVNEEVVARLHEHNRDKETPPLVAFPWIGSQFLSHAFLALEETSTNSAKYKFSHITRFLNMANNLAAIVSGPGEILFLRVMSHSLTYYRPAMPFGNIKKYFMGSYFHFSIVNLKNITFLENCKLII